MAYDTEEVPVGELWHAHIGRIAVVDIAGQQGWFTILGILPAGAGAWLYTAHRNPIFIEPGQSLTIIDYH